jgi:hypothetical protein
MMSNQGLYRAPRRLYLSRDKERVVEEGDPEAGFLLAGEGAEVPEEDVKRYKLRDLPDPEPKAAPKGKSVAGPPEDKAQDAPEKPSGRKASA